MTQSEKPNRARRFLERFYRDESGPNTVEWVLLIIIALIVLIAIYIFANFVIDSFKENQQQIESDTQGLGEAAGG